MSEMPTSVVVTGALGNMGFKVLKHLAAHGAGAHVIGLDAKTPTAQERREAEHTCHPDHEVHFVECDLKDWNDARWRDVFDRTAAVIHFAAQFPYPESTWRDSDASYAMTLNTAQAAAQSRSVKRYVITSSNHVMGGYKDRDIGPGALTEDLQPDVGTVWHNGESQMNSAAYAATKWAGEKLCQSLAAQHADTSFICVRVGWCQPGENSPKTVSASGTPNKSLADDALDESAAATDLWFRRMWISNNDCCRLFQRTVEAPADTWPSNCIIVNGVSNNTGTPWSLDEGRRYLGFEPVDNVFSG